jgi:hypothetical protein
MNTLYLFAMGNLVICAAIFFISICRLTAMNGDALYRVRSEYTAYIAGALVCGLQPWWGEWPQLGTLCMAGVLLIGLLCSGHAWRHGQQDTVPDIATSDHAPLEKDAP